jgi:hypothetical protein
LFRGVGGGVSLLAIRCEGCGDVIHAVWRAREKTLTHRKDVEGCFLVKYFFYFEDYLRAKQLIFSYLFRKFAATR